MLKDQSEDIPRKKKFGSSKGHSSNTEGSAVSMSGFIKLILVGAILVIGVTFARTYARQNRGLYIAGMEVLNAHGGVGSFKARHRF